MSVNILWICHGYSFPAAPTVQSGPLLVLNAVKKTDMITGWWFQICFIFTPI